MWLAGRPSAGGKLPEWQVEQVPATLTCVWFQLVGFQPFTLWQLMQLAVTGMWFDVLPLAVAPL